MSAAGGSSKAELVVALDIRDPFSYLALGPALELVREHELAADWLPLRGHTLVAPSAPKAGDDRSVRHRWSRAQMIAREIAVYSEAQGLTLEAPYRGGPADAFHSAWLWVRAAHPAALHLVLGEAFRAYWSQDFEPESVRDARALLERSDLDTGAFDSWSAENGEAAAETARATLEEIGLFQTPAYVIEDEVFYGRQHLPMIRWILGGRSGPVPI